MLVMSEEREPQCPGCRKARRAYKASLAPVDPIYRDSAHALEALPGHEQLSWMADLTAILSLPETTGAYAP